MTGREYISPFLPDRISLSTNLRCYPAATDRGSVWGADDRTVKWRTNIYELIRELSGPRPLCRVVDIVPEPRIWNHTAGIVLLENQPTV